MKKLILVALVLSAVAHAESPGIYTQQGKFLGNLNNNQYDVNSVANPYGQYGSQYSADSINNPYGQYGSQYSPQSPNNPYGQGVQIRGGRY